MGRRVSRHQGVENSEKKNPELYAAQAQRQGVTPEEVERGLAERTSVRKIIDAQDIAYVVTFLASPKSIAINGDVIAAGGGPDEHIYY